jgi:cytochrome b561
VAQVHPSAVDQLSITAPLGSGPPKKKRLVLASKCKQHVPSDQVTTELFPHHSPHCSLGLVVVKLVFMRLFEALQRPTQAAQINTSVGADTQPAKRLRASSMRKMLTPRYVTVLTCALLLMNSS